MAIQVSPTSQKCPDCGHFLDRAEQPKTCCECGAYPLCAVCIIAHQEDAKHWTEDVGDGSDGR